MNAYILNIWIISKDCVVYVPSKFKSYLALKLKQRSASLWYSETLRAVQMFSADCF